MLANIHEHVLPSSFVFVSIFHSAQVQSKKVCGKKRNSEIQGTHIKRVRKVKIKIAASKADKTQNQYKSLSDQQAHHFDQSQVNLSK